MIRSFHAYHTKFNPRSRLLIVGIFSLFERYLASLNHLVEALDLEHVHFTGHVTDEELVAYYDVADLFLCASEHEGFCVPLVEAFYKRVPVLAYAATAVPSTMDGGGVLFDDKDPFYVASLMDAILSDVDLEEAILERQSAAVRRLRAKDFDGTLLTFVNNPAERAALRDGARWPSTSGSSSMPRKRSRSCGCTGPPSTRRCPTRPRPQVTAEAMATPRAR